MVAVNVHGAAALGAAPARGLRRPAGAREEEEAQRTKCEETAPKEPVVKKFDIGSTEDFSSAKAFIFSKVETFWLKPAVVSVPTENWIGATL